jgi:hypothetical protein
MNTGERETGSSSAQQPGGELVQRAPWFAVWLKIIASFAATAVILSVMIPRLPVAGNADVPPIGMLLASGLIVAFVTTVAIYFIVRFDLGLGLSVALFTIGYSVLVVAVKFVVAPSGLYEINTMPNPPTSDLSLDNSFAALVTAVLVFFLYLIGYRLVYRRYRRRIANLLAKPRVGRRRRWVVILFALLILAAATGLTGAWVVLAFTVPGALDYLGFVFSSSLSLLVALLLAGAIALASLAFRDAAEKARLVGDAALLVNAFWIGLAFLALYHVLWVVYILMLTAIWPLKVVTPK